MIIPNYKYPPDYMDKPRVTEVTGIIAKPELIQWAAKEAIAAQDVNAATKIKERRADQGSKVHKYVELYNAGGTFSIDADVSAYWNAYLAFRNDHHIVPIYSEVKVDGDGYRGTADDVSRVTCTHTAHRYCLGNLADAECLIDYKTVRSADSILYPVYKEHRLQVEAYRRGLARMGLGELRVVAILRLSPDRTYHFKTWDSLHEADEAWDAFRNALRLKVWCSKYDDKKKEKAS